MILTTLIICFLSTVAFLAREALKLKDGDGIDGLMDDLNEEEKL